MILLLYLNIFIMCTFQTNFSVKYSKGQMSKKIIVLTYRVDILAYFCVLNMLHMKRYTKYISSTLFYSIILFYNFPRDSPLTLHGTMV